MEINGNLCGFFFLLKREKPKSALEVWFGNKLFFMKTLCKRSFCLKTNSVHMRQILPLLVGYCVDFSVADFKKEIEVKYPKVIGASWKPYLLRSSRKRKLRKSIFEI